MAHVVSVHSTAKPLPTSWRLSRHSCSCAATATAPPSLPAALQRTCRIRTGLHRSPRLCSCLAHMVGTAGDAATHLSVCQSCRARPPPSDSLPSVHNPTSRRWSCPSRTLLCRQHWALQPDDHAGGPVRPGGPLPNLCFVEPRVQRCTGGPGRAVEQLLRCGRKGAGRQAALLNRTAATCITLLPR